MNDVDIAMLRGVRDRQEIEQLLTTYARGIDRLDLELLLSVYHEDAVDEHANFSGPAREFATYALDYLHQRFVCTMHHVTHSNIGIRGNEAAAESYYYAYHRMEGDYAMVAEFFGSTYADKCRAEGTLDAGHEFICGGRYIDRLSKRDDVWRIAKRRITVEWKSFRPASHGDADSGIAAIVAPMSQDREDAVYKFFGEIGL